MTGNNEGAILAGRAVLAIQASDPRELAAVLRDAAATPAGLLGLLTTLAGTVAAFAREREGDQWEQVFVTTLHAMELDEHAGRPDEA